MIEILPPNLEKYIQKGSTFFTDEYVFSECFQKNGYLKRNNKEGDKLISIKANNFKYIFDEEQDQEFLFDIQSDLSEKKNLIKDNCLKLTEFRKIKDEHLQEVVQTSEEQLKILRAISSFKNHIKDI